MSDSDNNHASFKSWLFTLGTLGVACALVTGFGISYSLQNKSRLEFEALDTDNNGIYETLYREGRHYHLIKDHKGNLELQEYEVSRNGGSE